MNNSSYLARIDCLTYNHSKYIVDAMNGFCRQDTCFPFICTILDDASTDGQQEIISQYIRDYFTIQDVGYNLETEDYCQLVAQHNTNRNCFFRIVYLKYNHYQIKKNKQRYFDEIDNIKYIAICEGDDYWISPDKLQKQIDFLENHPNHSLCIHAYRRDDFHGQEIKSSVIRKYSHDVEIIPDSDVINGTGMFGATASMVYRASAVQDYPEWTKRSPVGDRPLKFVLFARGHIAYLNDVMSVYRVGVPGSWTQRVRRNRTSYRMTRQRFIQLMLDFDNWTGNKYHSLVKRAIRDYKIACRRSDIRHYLLLPVRFFKNLIK